MTDIKRLELGCMGMNMSNKERSIYDKNISQDYGKTSGGYHGVHVQVRTDA